MNEEEVYKIINKEPIEYANLLKDIKTRADSNKNLDGKSECKLLMRYLKKQWKEIERLNNIINELEKELFGMYVDIAGWNEDYAKKRIEKIKDSNKECELIKNNKKDVSIKSDELKCQFSDIWEYGDR